MMVRCGELFEEWRGTLDNESSPDLSSRLEIPDISSRFKNRLTSISLTDNRGFEADTIEIQLDDSDGLLIY